MPDFEYLKYIRVYGNTEDSEEIFEGLGASAVYGGSAPGASVSDGSDGDTVQEPAPLPEALWTAQSAVITSHVTYMNELAALYSAQKEGTLKKLFNYGADKFVAFVIAEVLEKLIPLDWAGEFGDDIADILAEQMYSALSRLLKGYSTGTLMFENVALEDAQLLDMDKSEENYWLRSEALKRNTETVQSMISVILDAESLFQLSLGLNLTGSAKGELTVSEEALQALEDLKWNNIHVIGKDGKKILLSNKTFAEDS